jgi:hypothetical protein
MAERRESVQLRALRRAAQVVGSTEELARRLEVAHDVLLDWLEKAQVPEAYFLRAVDVLLEASPPAHANR